MTFSERVWKGELDSILSDGGSGEETIFPALEYIFNHMN